MLLLRNTFVALATMVLFALSAPSADAGKIKGDPLVYAARCSDEIRLVYDKGVREIEAATAMAIEKIDALDAQNAPRWEMIRAASNCVAQLEEISAKRGDRMRFIMEHALGRLDKVGAPDEVVGIVMKHGINIHNMENDVLDMAIIDVMVKLNRTIFPGPSI